LFKIQKEYWSTLKSFLLYLNILREDELKDIEEDIKVQQVLKEL
jgi:small nuclear ribonucleoprotein (snRNP)-like protein